MARGTVGGRVGGTGGQRLDGLGCQAGFGWLAETRKADRASLCNMLWYSGLHTAARIWGDPGPFRKGDSSLFSG